MSRWEREIELEAQDERDAVAAKHYSTSRDGLFGFANFTNSFISQRVFVTCVLPILLAVLALIVWVLVAFGPERIAQEYQQQRSQQAAQQSSGTP